MNRLALSPNAASRASPNQALEQPRDSVLRYGESIGCELLNFFVIQSQNAEVGYLYRRRLHVDEEKCPKRLLVDVVQPLRQEVSISRRINFQPPSN